MQNIPQHKLSEHLRLCKGPTSAPPLHPYSSIPSFHTSSLPNLHHHTHQHTQPFETAHHHTKQPYETQPLQFHTSPTRTQSFQSHHPAHHQIPKTPTRNATSPPKPARTQTHPTNFHQIPPAAENPTPKPPSQPQKSVRETVPKAMYHVETSRGGGLSGGGWEEEEEAYREEEQVVDVPSAYPLDEDVDDVPPYQAEEPRYPCPLCGRKFMAEDRLEKHANACNKLQKQRKVFDAIKARTKGTELEQYVVRAKIEKEKESKKGGHRKTYQEDLPLPAQHQKPSWKIKHENFIQMVRAARQPPPSKSSHSCSSPSRTQQPPQPSYQPDPSLVQCDGCGRRFNPDTAERHIPICKGKLNKGPGRGGNDVGMKEEMLKKRTAYKPPVPKGKSPGKVGVGRR
ncbi:Zinc finger C2HC domain-containing protein 1A [Rhizophlyctis rosea]|uniref:Zinc finger C2HC domain-containing protein 1A n=1 Tax=Rhizophlyctis rosea TaxID=64517 RepID=A0AAD5S5V7_9FUNG|nr:Zinc finger C2HC domain-containing protein 1A [Rhizophlyctis rosea]